MQTAEAFMARAIRLSRRGFPAPNPHVGCVIVKDGQVVGEGWHSYAGGPHAEVVALSAAGPETKGATAYVTLEPCNHTGRTGPCSRSLIHAGVREVVFACQDPNSRASGGAEALRVAGVRVSAGLLEEEAREANIRFMRSHELGRPYVLLKAAVSLDGRIALPSGESRWITGEAARKAAHRLRAEMGCVLVGGGTVVKDDPSLTARLRGVKNQPVRVVLDPEAAIPATRKVFSDGLPTLRIVAPGKQGIEIPLLDGAFDLHRLLGELWGRDVNGILVEGGAATLSSFLAAGLADRIELFVAPVVLGAGPSWIEGGLTEELAHAPRFRLVGTQRLGEDLRLSYEP